MSGRILVGDSDAWSGGTVSPLAVCVLAPNPSPWTLNGTNTWIVGEAGGGCVVIDPGPLGSGHAESIMSTLDERSSQVTAILLTHAHVDHLGTAIWFAREHNTPVYCHAAEVGHARRDYLQQVSPAALAAHAWQPRWLRWSAQVAARGGLVRDGIPGTTALTEEIAAALPGRPLALPTPGHTGGHCSYVVDGVLVTGDALVTGHPLSRRNGPQLLPSVFNHDQAQCRRSLEAIAGAGTEVLIPGHGPLWHGPAARAAREAAAALQ